MLSDTILAATIGTTQLIGKGIKNAVRGAVIFGSLAGGVVLAAHIMGPLLGLSLFGMATAPLVTIVAGAAIIGAALQFVTSFIPFGGKAPEAGTSVQDKAHDGIDSPARSRTRAKTVDDLPDINPDARTDNAARLGNVAPPSRDAGYAAAIEATRTTPAAPVNGR